MNPQESPASVRARRYRRFLFVLLAVSAALRVVLVVSGGERYWPDEVRYERSREAVEALRHADSSALRQALIHPDHLLFGVLGILPATAELAVGSDDRIPALFFSLFSVASLALVYILMRRLGENDAAAFLAALVYAASATQLYYARHLLPYDAAMAFGLGALIFAVPAKSTLRDSVLCGFLSAVSLLTYNGYFLLAGSALVIHALGSLSWRDAARRLGACAGAFVIAIAGIAIGDALGPEHFLKSWTGFSRTVVQGSFAEGWRLPFAYLWQAEHLLTALWLAAFVFAVIRLLQREPTRALVVGVIGVLLIYGGLAFGSVVLQRLVVYGRQVRQLVPFACVLSGVAIHKLAVSRSSNRFLAGAIVAATLAQAALNFRGPLTQVFPEEFRRMAEEVPNPDKATRLLLYAEHIYPRPAPAPPGGTVLLARPHPLQFLPYQYEGYTPEERAALRAIDIRMRLVEFRTR